MDENAQSFAAFYNQPESPKIHLPKPAGLTSSGLTLVIPSLKTLKASQSANKRKNSPLPSFQDVVAIERKQPRPVKLKPLKEVLEKLITQLKKKDDYAFFLQPVDAASVLGYADVVKHPMDLGTMSDKVYKSKYRSLEEFASDFRLVTGNAKLFNPPGTIYHTEADKLEIWGLDHISKAASTVIQYETDWNIDIEKDEEPPVNVDEEEEDTTMDIDATNLRERSVSVASQVLPQQGQATSSRRGPRGPYKKNPQGTNLSETLEHDGGLPGSKDGLGSFPSGSDWAKTMVALKLKGKRYRTKKERLRFERDGPPYLADGSLDYTEMEDPFSVLSYLVPDPPVRPHLLPLYPPLYNPPTFPAPPPQSAVSEPSTSSTPQPSSVPLPSVFPLQPSFPLATTVPPNRHPLTLPFLQETQGKDSSGKQTRRRHWTIVRNASSRQKGKEREDESDPLAAELPPWQFPREPHYVDYGSLSVLAGALAEEMKKLSSSSSTTINGTESNSNNTDDHEVSMDLIRKSLSLESIAQKMPPEKKTTGLNGYFSRQRVAEAEEYIRDLVYGGVDGLAYIRSLAEFVDGNTYHTDESESPTRGSCNPTLGMPLSKWVEQNVVDPLTGNRQSLLRETAVHLARQKDRKLQVNPLPIPGSVASQVAASLHLYPSALVALSALLHVRLHKIDMGSLIKTPNELFLSEEEWYGKTLKERRKEKMKAKEVPKPVETVADDDAMEVEEPEQTWAAVDASLDKVRSSYEQEGPEELDEVLNYVANAIIEIDRKNREEQTTSTSGKVSANGTDGGGSVKTEPPSGGVSITSEEDAKHRNLRLNLLALAKRAPLDTIARLPKDLVPEHIRHFVPTLSTTG